MGLITGKLSISQVAKQVGVSQATLRVWEGQGYIPRATRYKLNKTRFWSQEQVRQIMDFVREAR